MISSELKQPLPTSPIGEVGRGCFWVDILCTFKLAYVAASMDLRKCLSKNGFFKAVWYISLNPFVSKLPSGSYKYSSLTSSALMLKLGKLCADAPMRIVASPLPSMVFTPPSIPPFPGDRNPSGEGSTNCFRFLLNLMNVQSSNIKIQSVG